LILAAPVLKGARISVAVAATCSTGAGSLSALSVALVTSLATSDGLASAVRSTGSEASLGNAWPGIAHRRPDPGDELFVKTLDTDHRAADLLFRLVTFWLPILPWWLALVTLERRHQPSHGSGFWRSHGCHLGVVVPSRRPL
jgi:hypothetical protein